jgi:hypothetical protein
MIGKRKSFIIILHTKKTKLWKNEKKNPTFVRKKQGNMIKKIPMFFFTNLFIETK